MIQYKFHHSTTANNNVYNIIEVDFPFEFLSQIAEGNETSEAVRKTIEGIQKVMDGAATDFYFGNDSGFTAVAAQADPENEKEPDEGVYIYDAYGEDSETALYILPFQEIIALLEAFEKFLKENGR